jgi:hypothetical protein
MGGTMKVVAINLAPQIRDDNGVLRPDVTDLNKIIDGIDQANGRNDALRSYIYALRDLQHAHDSYAITGAAGDGDIDCAEDAVKDAFDHLTVCQLSLLMDRWK